MTNAVPRLRRLRDRRRATYSSRRSRRNLGTILREQLGRQISDAALLAKIDHVLAELRAGRTVAVDDLPDAIASLFRPSVQPFLISSMKYDPAAEIATLEAPALIAQLTTDIQVTVQYAKLLSAAKPDASLALIEEMMHELEHATLDDASQQKAYTDPKLPIVSELIDRAASFVDQKRPWGWRRSNRRAG